MLKIRISSPRTIAPTGLGSRIVIIGGGFTGATVARLLVERGYGQIEEVSLFEPREHLGTGLAYGTGDPDVRLNVAAHRMRAIPGVPAAFLDWLHESGTLSVDPAAITSEGIFARRRDFGRFMQQQIAPFVEAGTICHHREAVTAVSRANDEWHVRGAGGTTVVADILILATGHPAASTPKALAGADLRSASCIKDALAPGAFEDVKTDDAILVVGSGLTAMDALVRLNAKGHRGKVCLLSRSGLLPRLHAGGGFMPYGNFEGETLTTARRLLRQVRATITEAEDIGIPWQSVFDALRQQAQPLWRRLPKPERQKLLRHLRRWYDVHRYRMPPQASALLQDEIACGRVVTCMGELVSVRRHAESLIASIAARGSENADHRYDRIVLATGPEFRNYCTHQRFLLGLSREGVIQSDPLELGIECDLAGRAIGADGSPNTSLFIAGPPARAAFGELTGAPEIAEQAANLTDVILRTLSRSNRTIVIADQS